ncbi:MAG: HD domain-containing protein [Bacteroidetes bacterium]|nr:HD domain-containing protein [Bacteroidota bacterium]
MFTDLQQKNLFTILHFTDEELHIFKQVANAATALNFPVYIVGGYVRDKILYREVTDIDFVCVGSGIQLAQSVSALLPNSTNVKVFENFGTAHIHLGNLDLEFVGARKESYRSNSRKPIVEDGTLEDDQNRRDFTINALAISLNAENYGQLIDPFNGLQHLGERLIKTPLPPLTTFSDDPLRMMRAIRFASQLGFRIDEETFEAITKDKERIAIISQERITDELNKIILSPIPSTGFSLLSDCGLLEIIFPELYTMHGVDMKDGKGHKDNFYHTLEVLDNISLKTENLWLRWAALLHDIAKPATKRFYPKQGWTFHGHEALGARMVPKIFKRLSLPLDHKMHFVAKMVELHLRPISLTKENVTDSAIRRLLFDAGDDIDNLMLLCEADITTKNRLKIKQYRENFEMVRQKLKSVEEHDHIRNFQPPVTGDEIMRTFNLKPGREVGIIKNHIRESILDGIIQNDYANAKELMLKKGLELGLKVNGK